MEFLLRTFLENTQLNNPIHVAVRALPEEHPSAAPAATHHFIGTSSVSSESNTRSTCSLFDTSFNDTIDGGVLSAHTGLPSAFQPLPPRASHSHLSPVESVIVDVCSETPPPQLVPERSVGDTSAPVHSNSCNEPSPVLIPEAPFLEPPHRVAPINTTADLTSVLNYYNYICNLNVLCTAAQLNAAACASVAAPLSNNPPTYHYYLVPLAVATPTLPILPTLPSSLPALPSAQSASSSAFHRYAPYPTTSLLPHSVSIPSDPNNNNNNGSSILAPVASSHYGTTAATTATTTTIQGNRYAIDPALYGNRSPSATPPMLSPLHSHADASTEVLTPRDICCVCGDFAATTHYGPLTCAGCDSFFRRIVLSGTHGTLYLRTAQCSGTCPITPLTRRQCRYCRFQRCLSVGMSLPFRRVRSIKSVNE